MVPIAPNVNTKVDSYQLSHHWDSCDDLFMECGILLNLNTTSIISNLHYVGWIFACVISHRAALIMVRFTRSANPFICGWCVMVVV